VHFIFKTRLNSMKH